MSDEPVPFQPTAKAELLAARLRIADLEHMLRHFDRSSMHLYHYCHNIERVPLEDEWALVKAMVDEMVDPYGPRNPDR